jgi:hypothetical protein
MVERQEVTWVSTRLDKDQQRFYSSQEGDDVEK